MAKMKFNQDDLEEVTAEAALQAKTVKEVKETKTLTIRGVSAEQVKTLKENGFTYAGFAKAAVQEKMKRDGLI